MIKQKSRLEGDVNNLLSKSKKKKLNYQLIIQSNIETSALKSKIKPLFFPLLAFWVLVISAAASFSFFIYYNG